MLKNKKNFIPVEKMIEDMDNLEQFVQTVVNYTSKYNNSFSINYAPENLVGKYTKYPSYGDFTETYILRTYGKWWNLSEATQDSYRPQDIDPYGAEDYITLRFESAVVPRHVFIYETYNPGAIVRIWGRLSGQKWKLLWEGPPQYCPEEARKFAPHITELNCLINELRLEINQSHLKYYTSIDAVLLSGYQPTHALQYSLLEKDLLNWSLVKRDKRQETEEINEEQDFFSKLPHEIIVKIFENLDLKSLSRCAQVNKKFLQVSLDQILYQNLSLKYYWNKIDETTITYFMDRCLNFKKIDLNWCNYTKSEDLNEFYEILLKFFQNHCKFVTHLSMNYCDFLTNRLFKEITTNCKELKELRLRSTKIDCFQYIILLNKIVTLDLYCTQIDDNNLILILKSNPNLKYLNLDFCENLKQLDFIVDTCTKFNKQLISWSSWKTRSLTATGISLFSLLNHLKELDLGWCLMLSYPGNCLEKIANSCTNLQRLIISQWRGVNDHLLLPIIMNCKNLTQLDLLGIKGITTDICEKILINLPKLQLLDISFCDSISNEKIELWRKEYPQVTIQRSCQFVVMEYWN